MKFLVKDSSMISIVNKKKENLCFPTFKFCYCVCIFTGLNLLNLSVLIMPIKNNKCHGKFHVEKNQKFPSISHIKINLSNMRT